LVLGKQNQQVGRKRLQDIGEKLVGKNRGITTEKKKKGHTNGFENKFQEQRQGKKTTAGTEKKSTVAARLTATPK